MKYIPEKYKQAELFYEKCEIPAVKEKDKEDCILYILADESMLNIFDSEGKDVKHLNRNA